MRIGEEKKENNMLTFYNKHKSGDFSQNGEAGIINECLKRIGISKGTAIEFGAPTREYCSNIFHLPEPEWTKLYYDDDPKDPYVMRATITPDNINGLVPSCNVLSMDTDGADFELFWAWESTCDILIIEINSSFAPTVEHHSKDKGASYRSMCKLLIGRDYFVICHTGNIIAVASKYRSLFPEIPDDPVEGWALFFNTKWLV